MPNPDPLKEELRSNRLLKTVISQNYRCACYKNVTYFANSLNLLAIDNKQGSIDAENNNLSSPFRGQGG
jgi:hypothetical protein